MRIHSRQLGVVVQHFLEVRHDPCVVDAITREAAGKLIVDAAARHRLARALDHLQRAQRLVTQQKFQHSGRRKLRRTAESAVYGVEITAQRGYRLLQNVRIGWRALVGHLRTLRK